MNKNKGKPVKQLDDTYLFFLESMKDGAVIIGKDYTITYANQGFISLVGSGGENPRNSSVLDFIHEADVPALQALLSHPSGRVKSEIIIKTIKKTYVAAYVSAAVLKSGRRDVICMVFSDLSEHRLTRELLAKDEFISIASHELKTPLTTVRAFTQLLLKYFSAREDMKATDYLRRMDKQLNRLTGLVANLLDISRIQSGKMLFNEETFSITGLIDEIISDISTATGTHIFVREGTPDTRVRADRYRIGQVLENIIRNAMKYSPRSRDILIRTERKGRRVLISIRDYGIGIPTEQKEKIFERFYRAGGTSRNSYPGLGLGLYISREIMHRHNGRIWVESEEGRGSTFFLELPIHKYDVSNVKYERQRMNA